MATRAMKRRGARARVARRDLSTSNATKLMTAAAAGGVVGGLGPLLLAYAGANPYGVGVGATVAGAAGTFAFKRSGQKVAQYFCAGVGAGGAAFTASTYATKRLLTRKAADGGMYLEERNASMDARMIESGRMRPLEPRVSCDLTFPDREVARVPRRQAELPPDVELAMAEARAELEEDDELYDDYDE